MEWKDTDGNVLSSEQLKSISEYIFYSEPFRAQAIDEYDRAIDKYGEGKVAISYIETSNQFSTDWGNMDGKPSVIVIDFHGKNQSIAAGPENDPTQQITSTGDGKTNISGTAVKNVQDLPQPKANLRSAELQLNTCHSLDYTPIAHGFGDHLQGNLKGTKETVGEAFSNTFHFYSVRGTSGAVNYTLPLPFILGRYPIPENGVWKKIFPKIDSPLPVKDPTNTSPTPNSYG